MKLIAVLALFLVMVIGGGVAAALTLSRMEVPDKFACLPSSDAVTVAWADITSFATMTDAQRRDAKAILRELYFDHDDFGFNEKLIFLSSEKGRIGSIGSPTINRCKVAVDPPHGAYAEKAFDEDFADNFAPHFDEVLKTEHDGENDEIIIGISPILETLYSISKRNYFSPDSADRQLVIVSDGILNSPIARWCGTERGHLPRKFETFRERFPEFFNYEPYNFQGAKVKFYLIEHPAAVVNPNGTCTTSEIKSFYEQYFEFYGADADVEILNLHAGAF